MIAWLLVALVHVAIGSKAFPESWVLGEALRALAAQGGAEAEHRQNLGGTEIVLQALRGGTVDAYVEYTGTIDEVILPRRDRSRTMTERRAELAAMGVGATEPLGFDDSYALAVAARAASGIATISDLAAHPELRFALTHEFMGRGDGWPGLVARYGLAPREVRAMQHDLAFEGIASGAVDVVDVYTTDAQIPRLGLTVLRDDRGYFPRYDAVILYRLDLPDRAPAAWGSMSRLIGGVDAGTMARANAMVVFDHASPADAAATLLPRDAARAPVPRAGVLSAVAHDTWQHLLLVLASLAAAIALGVPLGIVAARSRSLAAVTMVTTGVLQTIPSLALLALLVPLLGIGAWPAVVALFFYALLPIVQGTYTGLVTISPHLSEAAEALALSPWARLSKIDLPLASPAILAGIRTSAVINVGTATIAALVGAEGLGNPILQGISLRDTALILRGAVPAALLAIAVQLAFAALGRVLVPRGLRLEQARAAAAR